MSDDDTVIGPKDLMEVVLRLKKILTHFQFLYEGSTNESFAMDVEFKIDRDGQIAIKQALPWMG